MKFISKALSTKLKNVFPSLISANQTAYIKIRFIVENSWLISDILEMT